MTVQFSNKRDKVSEIVTKTKWQIRAEKDSEYNELMFLRWHYSHIQAYINLYVPRPGRYDTFQEWIIDYYEHPEYGSNYKLKCPESYKKDAKDKIYINHGKITRGDNEF
jgi:hypothetical protein